VIGIILFFPAEAVAGASGGHYCPSTDEYVRYVRRIRNVTEIFPGPTHPFSWRWRRKRVTGDPGGQLRPPRREPLWAPARAMAASGSPSQFTSLPARPSPVATRTPTSHRKDRHAQS
jgi:hypothetical protein